MSIKKIYQEQNSFFSRKFSEHGSSPMGLDFNSVESQQIRFIQIYELLIKDNRFSLNDFGCGLADFYKFLKKRKKNFIYYGYDINKDYIKYAKSKYPKLKIFNSMTIKYRSDYSIASGVMNLKLSASLVDWEKYIIDTLNLLNKKSIKGFAFNMLTKYSDKEKMRKDLYYGDPLFYFDYCKKYFSKNVRLAHDYDLYDFTILVRKS